MFELLGLGLLGLVIFLILLPLVLTLILGISFANMLGFTGISWWAFVIIFYLIISGILGLLSR